MSNQPDAPRMSYEGSGTRQIRATALGRGTQGVSDVRRMVESQFHVAFPHRVWVAGQVGAPSDSPDRTVRFPLRPSTGDDPYVLPCVVPGKSLPVLRELLHRTHDAELEDVVSEGRLARVGGLLRYDAERNAVVFVVSELDPTPTALELADARAVAVQAVRDAGLAAAQRAHGLGTAPLEVSVVGGAGDAALDRVDDQLAGSRFDVQLTVVPVGLAGPDGATRLARAVTAAAQRSDVVLLVRGEGRPLGLAPYDSLEAAQAVADAPVPVLAGLGGGGVRTAVDEVAFASLPTAQAAADEVLHRLDEAERVLEGLAADVATEADEAAERCRRLLDEAEADVTDAGEQAQGRSEQARKAARLRLLVACLLLAVVAAVAAAVTGRPLLLLGLLVPVLLYAGVELWWRSPTRGSRRMGQRDDDFTQVLVRLHAVRDELQTTRSPERVVVLREVAGELVAQGRTLLRRLEPAPAEAPDEAPAETDRPRGSGVEQAVEASPSGEPDASSTRVMARPAASDGPAAAVPPAGAPDEAAVDRPAPSG